MLADGFSLEFERQKSPQVSRTRLRILAVLSNAVVGRVSTRPPISKFSRPFNNPLVIVTNALITIGTIVTLMFHSFFSILLQGRSTYPSFHFPSDLFCGPPGKQSLQFCTFTFFLLIINIIINIIIIICQFKSNQKEVIFTGPNLIITGSH